MVDTTLPEVGNDVNTAVPLSLPGRTIDTALALDFGQRTGWALRMPRGAITSGVMTFRPGRYEGAGMAYLRFERWLADVKALTGELDAVFFEEVRAHRGTDASHWHGGFLGVLTAWCEHHEVEYEGVPVGTIKRHVTGKGNADKQAVIDAVRKLGHDPADDNEADALALLYWAIVHRIDGVER